MIMMMYDCIYVIDCYFTVFCVILNLPLLEGKDGQKEVRK